METVRPDRTTEADSRVRRPLTVTERSWLGALLILVGSVAAFGSAYALELELGRWNRAIRFVSDPSETPMRYLGISHFLVAFLFIFTSRKMRGFQPWTVFAALFFAGIVVCAGYSRLLAFSPLLAGVVFFGYFLVHDFRDQVFFYFVNGDARESGDSRALAKILVQAPLLVLAGLASVLVALVVIDLELVGRIAPPLGVAVAAMPDSVRWALGVIPASAVVAAALRLRREWRRQKLGSIAGFVRRHRPVFAVLAGSLLVLAVGLTAGRAHSIVILHVAGWYVFSLRMLRERRSAPEPRPLTWNWLRSTPSGFNVVHVGSAALLVVAGLVWAFGFRNDPSMLPFRLLLDRDGFAYWTIIHVTVSLAPR